jgi:hypothetical protein
MIEAKIEDGYLIVRAKLQTPTPSATGKTLVVASSHGNVPFLNVLVDDLPVFVGLNAYIKPERRAVPVPEQPKAKRKAKAL